MNRFPIEDADDIAMLLVIMAFPFVVVALTFAAVSLLEWLL